MFKLWNFNMKLEKYFSKYRKRIVGIDQEIETPFGIKKIVYADWTASGRIYGTIENRLKKDIFPFVGNTHTETTETGSTMTYAYKSALKIIKNHVGACDNDVAILSNSSMTGVTNKFQRILGLKVHEKFQKKLELSKEEKPIIFVSHMEHHSNHTSWLETIADVEVIMADESGVLSLEHLDFLLGKYKDREIKIAAITSCSNVTGIFTPYHQVAEKMHLACGLCFVDFAACAPYINIDMHPENELQKLDAIYFSPHKFLGGPGTPGALIFDSTLYKNKIPDNPGGGTVDWTNPWGEHKYVDDIEAREDGGTPGFLQTIKFALCVKLKEEMKPEQMLAREKEMLELVWEKLEKITNLHILADSQRDRLAVVSFYIDDLHYNLAVKILNDRFGIQMRGGCSCAGTYGHYLLNVSKDHSNSITSKINMGDLSGKPGWIRMSLHPTMTDEEVEYILEALKELCENHKEWSKDYEYISQINEFHFREESSIIPERVNDWYSRKLG
jgi:selenocysteine lyase/cysteine desulfurase